MAITCRSLYNKYENIVQLVGSKFVCNNLLHNPTHALFTL